jgi:hypothetical protein
MHILGRRGVLPAEQSRPLGDRIANRRIAGGALGRHTREHRYSAFGRQSGGRAGSPFRPVAPTRHCRARRSAGRDGGDRQGRGARGPGAARPAAPGRAFRGELDPLKAQHAELDGWQNADARRKVEARMKGLAGGLARDPQVESMLAGRRRELCLSPGTVPGRNLVQDLTRSLSCKRSFPCA